MNKKKLIILGILGLFSLVLVSAIAYYAFFSAHFDVAPAFSITGETAQELGNFYSSNEEIVIVGTPLTITSNAGSEREATLTDNSDETGGDVGVGYYGLTGYSEEFLAVETYLSRTDITVEDLGDSILWTMYAPTEYTGFGEGIGSGGQVTWSLSIGVGDEILYQVHSNDGTDASYPWGTYLYSEYDNGWHTGDTNTPVTEIEGIDTTGTYLSVDCEGVYTIQINKELLDSKEFKWTVNIPYEGYKSLPSAFSWGDTDTTNFFTATIMEELTTFTVPAGGSVVLTPVYTIAPYVTGEYTITTKVI